MVSILLYADDVVLISESSDGLQDMLNTLCNWSKAWMLKVNKEKSNIIHFRKDSHARTQHDFIYGDTTLDIVPTYRYLGLDSHEIMDFTESVQCLAKAAGRALGAVTNKYYTVNGLDYNTYDCEIWAGKKRDCWDPIQHRAIRTFLGVGKCAPLPMLYGDMAWIPSHVRQKAAMIHYWIRLTRMPATRLARRVFDWDHGRAKRGTCCHDMKQIFEKCDLIDAYKKRVLMHGHQGWNVRHGLCHIYMRYVYMSCL